MPRFRIAAQNFANIDLPMGGKITSVDADHIELVIPRIQLFDVWLQPRALAALRWGCLVHWVTRELITQVGTWVTWVVFTPDGSLVNPAGTQRNQGSGSVTTI